MLSNKKNIITIGDTKMNYQELAEVLTKTLNTLADQDKEQCCYGCSTMRSACTNPKSTFIESENFNESNLADLENETNKRSAE
jgi:hypothetical protein